MKVAQLFLYDIAKLAGRLAMEFGGLPYEKFGEDQKKIESAVRTLVIMKERWAYMPRGMREALVPIDWDAITGTWDRQAGRHVGIDPKEVWETIAHKFPELSKKAEELLKREESKS